MQRHTHDNCNKNRCHIICSLHFFLANGTFALCIFLLISCSYPEEKLLQRKQADTHQTLPFTFKPVKALNFPLLLPSYNNPFQHRSTSGAHPTAALEPDIATDASAWNGIDIDKLYLVATIQGTNTEQKRIALVTDGHHPAIRLVPRQKIDDGRWQVTKISGHYLVMQRMDGKAKKYLGFR